MAIQRRLVALIVADVVGYPRLIERDEDSTHERLRKLKTELIDPEIAEPSGRITKPPATASSSGFPVSHRHCTARSKFSARWECATSTSHPTT